MKNSPTIWAIATITILTIFASPKPVNGSELNNVVNGLFTPTAADRFFQKGVAEFEQEIRILSLIQDSDFTENILDIQTEFDDSKIPEAITSPENFDRRNF